MRHAVNQETLGTLGFEVILRLPYLCNREQEWVVASCPALNIRSQGRTEEEAREHLREEVELFMDYCFRGGTLNEVLREAGLTERPDERGRAISETSSAETDRIMDFRMPRQWLLESLGHGS
jgi:predicted RNase H-like HicB family nuclease